MTDQLAAHLWQSTWFAIAAALLTLAFRKNRAQVRYWMWTTASLKFLLPFALLMNLGDSLSRTPAAQQIASHEVAVVVERIAQPFSELVPPPAAASRTGVPWLPAAILGVWAVGSAAIAAMRLREWLRLRDRIRRGEPLNISEAVEVRSAAGLMEPGIAGWLHP